MQGRDSGGLPHVWLLGVAGWCHSLEAGTLGEIQIWIEDQDGLGHVEDEITKKRCKIDTYIGLKHGRKLRLRIEKILMLGFTPEITI